MIEETENDNSKKQSAISKYFAQIGHVSIQSTHHTRYWYYTLINTTNVIMSYKLMGHEPR